MILALLPSSASQKKKTQMSGSVLLLHFKIQSVCVCVSMEGGQGTIYRSWFFLLPDGFPRMNSVFMLGSNHLYTLSHLEVPCFCFVFLFSFVFVFEAGSLSVALEVLEFHI